MTFGGFAPQKVDDGPIWRRLLKLANKEAATHRGRSLVRSFGGGVETFYSQFDSGGNRLRRLVNFLVSPLAHPH